MKKLKLIHKEIDYDNSPLLLYSAPADNWEKDWVVKSGEWHYENGSLIGIEPGNKGGILFSRKRYDKNVMMSFTMATVLPATRDLNAVFCAHWDDKTDYLSDSYICGLNGWFEDKFGIERQGGFRAICGGRKFEPGKEYRMTVGAINGHCFMFVEDELLMEYVDPKPLLEGHIGFSAYCTILKIRDIEIREIVWQDKKQSYQPEFNYEIYTGDRIEKSIKEKKR